MKKVILQELSHVDNLENFAGLLTKANDIYYQKQTYPIFSTDLLEFVQLENLSKHYHSFQINKKSGGSRTIHAPSKELKRILKSISNLFTIIYEPHPAAIGFAHGNSIVNNAKIHIGREYVYNIDIKDFFYSFDQNDIRYALMKPPFNLNKSQQALADLLAFWCTHEIEVNGALKMTLPQGSPSSPILTNIICETMDRRITGLASRFGAYYSRYADDITFSSQNNFYNEQIFQNELIRILTENNLTINPKKTRLQGSGYRKEVTGLIVNKKVNVRRKYVRKLRMWIHYWERYGYDKAKIIYEKDHNRSNVPFNKIISGKLEFLRMVKSEKDSTYLKLKKRLDKLTINNFKEDKGLDFIVNLMINENVQEGIKVYENWDKK